MSPTKGNYDLLQAFGLASRDLGLGAITPIDPGSRGAADISFVAPIIDSLAGLGPVGSGSHSAKEDLDLATISIATLRAAIFIHRLTR